MELKVLIVFLVAGVAVADLDSGECSQSRVSACIDTLLEKALSPTTTEEEMCPVLKDAAKCLRSTAEECLGDAASDPNIQESLDDMDGQMRRNCPDDVEVFREVSDDHKSCFKANEEYLMSCVHESTLEVTKLENADPNVLKCTLYSLVSDCVIKRSEEKCGEAAGAVVKEEMEDMSEEIREACTAQDTLDFYSISLLDKRKRRK